MNKPSASEQFNRIVQTSSGILQIFRSQLSTHIRERSGQHLIDLGVSMKRKDMVGIRNALGGVRNDLKEIFDALDADNPNKATIAQCIQDINTWARENMARISPPQGHPALQHSAVSLPDIPDVPQDHGITKRHPHIFPLPTRPQPSHGNAMIHAVSPGNGQIQSGGHAVAVSSGPKRPTAPAISLPDISPEPLSGKTYYESGRPAVANAAIDLNMSQYFLALHRDGYKTVGTIGEGGMGFVVKAQNLRVGNREEAIKVITVPGSDRDLDREAEIGGMFELEDGIVRVNSAGEALGNKYIAMPYIANVRDLSNLPKTLELLPRHVMALGILKGLKNMHSKNILHRDMKPANVLATGVENGDIMHLLENLKTYLTDFGIALNLKKHEAVGRAGTPRYMSPEQIRRQKLTLASDVFSTGLTLYEIYTGELPFPKEILENPDPNVVMQYISKQKGSLIKANDKKLMKAGVPEEICELLEAMTHMKPEDRPDADMAFTTVDEYLHELRPDVQEAKRTRQQSRKRGLYAKLLGGALLVGAIGTGIYIPHARQQSRNEEFVKTNDDILRRIDGLLMERKRSEAIKLIDNEITRLEAKNDISSEVKAERLNILRCKKAYLNGVLAYNRGLVADAEREFAQVRDEYQFAGLSSEQKADFEQRTVLMQNWEQVYADIRTEVGRVYAIRDTQEFQRIVQGWRDAALAGDKDAVVKVLQMRFHIDNLPRPSRIKHIMDEASRRPRATNPIAYLRILSGYDDWNEPGYPEWREYYDQRINFVSDCIDGMGENIVGGIQRPHVLNLLQWFHVNRFGGERHRLIGYLELQEYDSYQIKLLDFLERARFLKNSIREHGEVHTVDQVGSNRIALTNTLISDCCSLGSRGITDDNMREKLWEEIQKRFSPNGRIPDEEVFKITKEHFSRTR